MEETQNFLRENCRWAGRDLNPTYSGDITRTPDKQSTKPLINHKNTEDDKDKGAMSETEKFLDYYKSARSKGTYKSYKRGLTLFEKYYGKSSDKALEERRQDIASKDFAQNQRFVREVEKFHSWLLDKGYSINTSRTMCLGIMQLFRYYGVPIVLPPQSKVSKTTITTKTHIPKIEELRRMFQVSDLRGRVILSMGLDLAWRIGDFLKLKKTDVPDLNQETPIKFEAITQKEDAISSTFLSSETVELLKAYLPTLPKENPYLFPSNGKRHLKDEAVNNILKGLMKKARIKIPQNKRFTFHSLRKRFLSTCYNLNIDSDVAKLLVGKSIGKSMETYLGDVNLKNSFVEVREKQLSLSNGTIKSTMESKDKEIAELKERLNAMQNVLLGLIGLNRDQIEQLVTKQLESEKVTIRGDRGTIPISEHVKAMTNEKLFQEFQRIQNKKQAQEYDKLLEETNGFNHKK